MGGMAVLFSPIRLPPAASCRGEDVVRALLDKIISMGPPSGRPFGLGSMCAFALLFSPFGVFFHSVMHSHLPQGYSELEMLPVLLRRRFRLPR